MTSSAKPIRLAYLVSHPIQYQAPLLRMIAQHPGIDLTVFFRSDKSVKGYRDPGFGQVVNWDTPLLEGYRHEFLPAYGGIHETSSFLKPLSHGLQRRLVTGEHEALWVHGYAPLFHAESLMLAKAMGLKTLLRDETWLDGLPRGPMKLAIKRAYFWALRQVTDAVLPIGQLNDAYWDHYGFAPQRRFLMPYAVDNARFAAMASQAAPRREQFRASLGLVPGRPVILFVAKLIPVKAPEILLRAVANLQEDNRRPYLLFVGTGEMKEALKAETQALNLQDTVRFLGFRNQSELPAFYDLCDVFCLPSRKEPWGLVVNEVMNAAKPVVVSERVGSGGDLVDDGVNGRIVPPEDVRALTEALRFCLRSDPEKMGRNSLAKIQEWGYAQDLAGLVAALTFLFPDRLDR